MPSAVQEQIDALLEHLGQDELLALIEQITQRLQQAERQPKALFGVWKGKFPEDVDIDEALQELRHQWVNEFEDSTR
jgi:hypothetical protein